MNTTNIRRAVCGTILCTLSLAFFVSPASAAIMAPGASLLAAAEPDPIGGVVVGATGPVPFANASYTGTLSSTVILGDTTNPFGPGALTFTYLLTNSSLSTGEINRLTVNDFAGYLVDASYQAPTAGLPPARMDRSIGSGDVVGFTFEGAPFGPGVLIPGTTGALMVVQTNATVFAPTVASVIDGVAVSVSSLAPAGIEVPEPCSVVLVGIGLSMMSCLRLRGRS